MAGGFSFNVGAKKGPKLAFGLKGQQKTPRPQAAFAPDSDEEVPTEPDQKRAKRTFTEAPGPPNVGPSTPLTEEEEKNAEKLAEFVAKHGRSFEDITRKRNTDAGPFRFLFDKDCQGYKFYEQKIREYSSKTAASFLSSTPIPPPQPPSQPPPPAAAPSYNQRSGMNAGANLPSTSASQPVPTALRAPQGQTPSNNLTAAKGSSQDSIAAMEAFTKLAARRDEQREEQESKQALLNETSFDRRRTIAVYKNDGSRGHHMQDYIPKEELQKFLAKSGSKDAQAQAEAIEAASRIQSDNVGHKLLSQMGWKEGQGLGAAGSGRAAPISASSDFGSEKRGLGAEDHTAAQEGDDEFELYRKRMMLGYKHRPNPLGNPRKAYY